MQQMVFSLLKQHFWLFLTFASFIFWLALRPSAMGLLVSLRRLTFVCFLGLLIYHFYLLAPKAIAAIDIIDMDVVLRQTIAMNKGTDWVEGFLYGIMLCFFTGIVLAFLAFEMKSTKKK